jgi:hypothetical protein
MKPRPMTASVPSVRKKFHDAAAPTSTSGSSPPVVTYCSGQVRYAATYSKVVLCSR